MKASDRLALASIMLCAEARNYIEADEGDDGDLRRGALEAAALNYAIEWARPRRKLRLAKRGGA